MSQTLSQPAEAGVSTGRAAVWMTFLLITGTLAAVTMNSVFTGEKMRFLYKDLLHLSASDVATVMIIVGIPGYLRPFMGAGSDLFPIFGLHRKPYYVLSWLLLGAGNLALGMMPHYTYWTVIALALVAAAGGNLVMVIVDAVMVAVGTSSGTIGRMQAVQQGIPAIMFGAFAGHMAGYVTQNWSYEHCFRAGALVCLLAIPLVLLLPEKRTSMARAAHETEEEHRERQRAKEAERAEVAAALKKAALTSGLWVMVAYVFYLIITPGTNNAQMYYGVDVLHFSKQFIGNLQAPAAMGAVAALALFIVVSRRLPIRAMVWGAYLMDCSIYLLLLGYRDHKSALIVTGLTAFIGMIYNLCLLTLAARACPPKIEATVYGLVTASITLAGSLGEKIGSSIYDFFGPHSHQSIAHGWYALIWAGFAFTVIAGFMIPFLPAWSRSNEPIHNRTGTTA